MHLKARKVFGEEHPDLAISLSNIGKVYSALAIIPKHWCIMKRHLEYGRNTCNQCIQIWLSAIITWVS